MPRRRAFTLLEVLIAVGVLFIVGSAVLSLSNTLIQGTVSTADTTVTNLWATEALELVTKNRDDRTNADANQAWLQQAEDFSDYGWYTVRLNGSEASLQKATINGSSQLLNITKAQAFAAENNNLLTSEGLSARRLICIEAVGVPSSVPSDPDRLRCNMDRISNGRYNDGARSVPQGGLTQCRPNDRYCQMTQLSLNRNNADPEEVLIPAGSAVKVRAVVVWQNQYGYQTTDVGTMLTNWRSVGQ